MNEETSVRYLHESLARGVQELENAQRAILAMLDKAGGEIRIPQVVFMAQSRYDAIESYRDESTEEIVFRKKRSA